MTPLRGILFLITALWVFFPGLSISGSVRTALAAPPVAYLSAQSKGLESWDIPLVISLLPDEALCREKYGQNWGRLCGAPVSIQGRPVSGITVTPPLEGEWLWEYGARLRFTPRKPVQPGVHYKVDLSKLQLPAGYSLSSVVVGREGSSREGNATITYSKELVLELPALPLGVEISDQNVWIDPAPKGVHAVSATLRFNWPVDPADMEKRISFRPQGGGLVLGKPDFIWNRNRAEVTVNARIATLAEKQVWVDVRVRDMLSLTTVQDGYRTRREAVAQTGGDATSSFAVPGRKGLFEVRRLELTRGHNAGLDQEQRLELETSLQVSPAMVQKALKLVALPRHIGQTGQTGRTGDSRPGEERGGEAVRPYDWSHAPVVSAEDLNRGETLKLEALQPADELTSRLSFRVRVASDAYVFAYLPAEFGSPDGVTLAKPWKGVLKAASLKPEIGFLQPGHILPLNGEGKIDIYASGLTSVRWEVARVREPFLALLAGDFYGGFAERRASDAMSEVARGHLPLARPEAERFSAQFATLGVKDLEYAVAAPDEKEKRGQSVRRLGGLMEVRLTGMDGDKEVATASRFILVTDLGMFIKRASDGRREVFVSSLSTGEPVAGARVRVLGTNGVPVIEAATDPEGRASLPAVDKLERESAPVAVVAVRPPADGGENDPGMLDFAWLSLRDGSRVLTYSSFPTGGRSASQDGLTAYVFGQRGIYRPGETLHFACIARRGDWAALPSSLPLKAVLHDPAENKIMVKSFSVGPDGLAELTWDSSESAMVGRYRLDVLIAGGGRQDDLLLGSGMARVEEFQPDTLSMRLRVGPENGGHPDGWFVTGKNESGGQQPQERLTASVLLKNLHGLPAQDRRVRATLHLSAGGWSFPEYGDYTFTDASPFIGDTLRETLPEMRTNEQGEALLSLPLSNYQAGSMHATLLVEGFEPGGGRAATAMERFMLSPLRYVLGYRPSGEGLNLDYIPQGRKVGLDFVALDSSVQRTDPGELIFSVFERRYVMSLVKDAQGRYRYDETPVDKPLSRSSVRFDKDKNLHWKLPTDTPGEYLLTVTSASASDSPLSAAATAGTRLASVPFTVAGDSVRLPVAAVDGNENGYGEDSEDYDEEESRQSWQNGQNGQNGQIRLASGKLRLRIDKSDYAAGEEIKLFLSAPYAGTGLITLERDGVVAHRWFRAAAGDSVHAIAVPEGFEGRGYVNVALVRAQTSPDIYMEPLSSAVVPFTANVTARDMGLSLTAPQKVRPGDTVTVRLTSREKGRAVVFAVDEGVLQLTGFKTPSPLDYLLRDRALDVETTQGFDLLMPDHARLSGRLPAFGGGAGQIGGRFHNPFKRKGEPPLAVWSSLLDVSPQGTDFSFTVPDYYNGQVRIMAVGASAQTAGSVETALTVRGPVVITPQLPLMAAPGDRFEASVGVSNAMGDGKSARFRVTLTPEGGLSLVGGQPEPLEIKDGNEALLTFALAAGEPGEGALTIRAEVLPESQGAAGSGVAPQAGESVASRRASLSVRPATPYRVWTRSGVAGFGRTLVPVERERYDYQRFDVFEASRGPLSAMRGLVRRLYSYPYGCTEQILSRAFPYVLLASHPELLTAPGRDVTAVRRETDEVVNLALSKLLASFRHGYEGYRSGGVAFWPGAQADELLTVYAGDFLLAMREAGKGVPGTLENGIFEAIERFTQNAPSSLAEARVKAYGIWVLTREGRITTQSLEELERNLERLSPVAGKAVRGGSKVAPWRHDVTAALMAGSYAAMRVDKKAAELLQGYSHDYSDFAASGYYLDASAASSLYAAVLARHFPKQLAAENQDTGGRLLDSVLLGLSAQPQATFSSAQAVRALLDLAGSTGEAAEKIGEDTILTCKDAATSVSSAPSSPNDGANDGANDGQELLIPGLLRWEGACETFSLLKKENDRWYWQLTSGGYDRTPPARAAGNGMSVERVWRNEAGEILKFEGAGAKTGPTAGPTAGTVAGAGNARAVALGEEITVSISARAYDKPLSNAVISDLLPGGFEMVMERSGQDGDGVRRNNGVTNDAGLVRAERREDRMLLFVDLDTQQRTWSYRIRAVNKGRFTLPPTQVEAMYDAALSAHTAAGTVEVR